ncbi:hypothetical protein VM1G_10979 [Cytospora mali]|uniref:Uncharacterized protein n=1 Tax=Cytospora mali TaxID=578113 RepID=A0A194VJL8_CYTMA|nr:hypothetical protein VM1G_10979 [Valsa mali]
MWPRVPQGVLFEKRARLAWVHKLKDEDMYTAVPFCFYQSRGSIVFAFPVGICTLSTFSYFVQHDLRIPPAPWVLRNRVRLSGWLGISRTHTPQALAFPVGICTPSTFSYRVQHDLRIPPALWLLRNRVRLSGQLGMSRSRGDLIFTAIDRSTDSSSVTKFGQQDTTMDEALNLNSDSFESDCSSRNYVVMDRVTPMAIDMKNQQAEAIWRSHRLRGWFSLFWNSDASKALLRLQVHIFAKRDTSNSTRSNLGISDSAFPERTSLYLFIAPERIRHLYVESCEESRNDFYGSVIRTLHFVLSSPPFLVVPGDDWEPWDDVSKATRDSLYGLAGETHFTISAKILVSMVSGDILRKFCTAASGGRLSADPAREQTSNLCTGKRRRRSSIASSEVVVDKKRLRRGNTYPTGLLGSSSVQPAHSVSEKHPEALLAATGQLDVLKKLLRLHAECSCSEVEGRVDAKLMKLEQFSGIEGRLDAKLMKLEQFSGTEGRLDAKLMKLEQFSGIEDRVEVKLRKLAQLATMNVDVDTKLIRLEELSRIEGRVDTKLQQVLRIQGRVDEGVQHIDRELEESRRMLTAAYEETQQAVSAAEEDLREATQQAVNAAMENLRQELSREMVVIKSALERIWMDMAVTVRKETAAFAGHMVDDAVDRSMARFRSAVSKVFL